MSFVGDIIMQLRRRVPDAPQVLPYPTALLSATPITITGGTLPAATTWFQWTTLTPWGESTPVPAQSVVLAGGNNAIQFVFEAPVGTTAINVYASQAAGQQANLISFPVTTTAPMTVIYGSPGQQNFSQLPPTRSTAFLPDTDGNFLGAFSAYKLLNEALGEMVRIAGGVIDVTGVQSTINTSMYRLNSPFYQFVNAWYDGYPMDVVPRNFMYLRNSAAGFSGILSYEQDGPQSTIQVWPQSNRTGRQNFLNAPLSATADSFLVSDGSGFLSIGLAQIDNEIVVYSQITSGGTVFSGVLRGMGGTDAAAHDRFAPVTELNIRLSGYRMARTYQVGESNMVIQVPQAWERPLVLHMLSQVRSMEQDDAAAKSLMGDFVQMADKIAKASRLGKIKPRQIPIWGQNTSDARNINGIGFGWLIN